MSRVQGHFGKRKNQGGDCERRKQYYLDFFVRNVQLLDIIISLLPEESQHHSIIPYFFQR